MREVETDNGTVKVTGISRGKLDELQNKGLPIDRWTIQFDPEDKETAPKLFDAVLLSGIVGSATDITELTPRVERKIFKAIIAETYGDEEEEKNLSRSGNGSQTESE